MVKAELRSSIFTWAPRVSRLRIKQLYESEARGRLDEALLDDVGIGLYARCESIIRLTEAYRGRVECPGCHHVIQTRVEGRHTQESLIKCPDCAWQMSWRAYKRTARWFDKRDDRLDAGHAEPVIRRFLAAYLGLKAPVEKMLLIDWLLHEFHISSEGGDTGPVAPMVIEGTDVQVMVFLDELAGLRPEDTAQAWRDRFAASGRGRYLGRQLTEGRTSTLVSKEHRAVLRRLAHLDGD